MHAYTGPYLYMNCIQFEDELSHAFFGPRTKCLTASVV
jgi:hypothetical protein